MDVLCTALVEGPNYTCVVTMNSDVTVCIVITYELENRELKGDGFCPAYVPTI